MTITMEVIIIRIIIIIIILIIVIYCKESFSSNNLKVSTCHAYYH